MDGWVGGWGAAQEVQGQQLAGELSARKALARSARQLSAHCTCYSSTG